MARLVALEDRQEMFRLVVNLQFSGAMATSAILKVKTYWGLIRMSPSPNVET
jgi:hypothetical protein